MKRILFIVAVCLLGVGCEEKKQAFGPASGDKPADKGSSPPPAAKAEMGDALAGTAKAKPVAKEPLPAAGQITAGSFDDNLDPRAFQALCDRSQQLPLGNLVAQMRGHRLLVNVRDAAGKPVNNANVRLSWDGEQIEAATRSDGRVVFVAPYDRFPTDRPLTATITPPDGSGAVRDTISAGVPRWDVTLPKAKGSLPKNLDFMIVLDTTGSMKDELKHLAGEIKGISQAIKERFPEVNQRFSLVCYRDVGDEYVTRTFDFTSSVDTFHRNLAAQEAGGGGDVPEAMHRGLEDAAQMRWRDNDETACLLFLVGDAPPQAQHAQRTMAAVNTLRKRGIAIYPIACSGYDEPCEFIMRSSAYLTGGQFLFLTDDSGIGSSHAEPRIPYYQVEHLNKLIVRMVASELSGRVVPAAPGDILRRVGKQGN